MKRNNALFLIPLIALFLFSGCASLVVGGTGELRTDYQVSFDRVWNACERTVADKRGTEVVAVRGIARGNITAVINDEKVSFDVQYKSKDFTTVSIRVGFIGNRLSSQYLHDRIAENMSKN